MDRWARAKYTPILPAGKNGEWVTGSKAHRELSKKAAKEGMVLLENNGALPLQAGTKVALLGKGTFDFVRGGGGSGDVYCAYSKNIYDGLKEVGGHEIYEPLCEFYRDYVEKQYKTGYAPGMVIEPEIPEELLKEASSFADTAIVSISRFSGEGWDRSEISFYEDEVNPWIIGQDGEEEEDTGSFENLCLSMNDLSAKVFPKRDFYLSDEEEKMIDTVRKNFRTGVGQDAGAAVFLRGHLAVLIGFEGQYAAEIHAGYFGRGKMDHAGIHVQILYFFLMDRNIVVNNFLRSRLVVEKETGLRGIGKLNGIKVAAFPLAVCIMQLPVIAAD